jgi:hypothetical protein
MSKDNKAKAKAQALGALLEGLVGVGKTIARAAATPSSSTPTQGQNGNLAGCGGCTAPGKQGGKA